MLTTFAKLAPLLRIASVVAAMLLAIDQVSSLHAAKPPRLNVLWICSDDGAPYVLGTYGNQKVHTPNIDRLAASGMRFDKAFCNSPICTASRQSFITGRYPRTLGVTKLQTALPASEETLGDILKSAGYQTAAIGKMHFNSALKHGFDLRLDLVDAHRAVKERGPKSLPPHVDFLPPWKPFKDPANIWLNSFYRPYGAVDADMAGTYFAEKAAQYLSEPHEKPFFLMVSFYEPHSPYHFPVEDRGKFNPASFPVPAVGPEDQQQIPAIFKDLTPAEKQGITASYYTSVEFLDRNVGRVLAALDHSGQAAHTLVIYTGDHGYLLGQHGRFEKHCSYEEAIRSALVIRAPGIVRSGSSSDALVEFIDIVPTVFELCGLPIPQRIQGKSLVRVLKAETPVHRKQVFIEYALNDEAAVRDDRWKLVYQRGKTPRTDGYDPGLPPPGRIIRLFDLQTDPAEMHNVAARPENHERVEQMLALLAAHLQKTAREPELIPLSSDLLEILDFCIQPRDVQSP